MTNHHTPRPHDMNSIALVTGAAGGLGRAITQQLAQAGWQVVVVGRDGARLQQAFGNAHRHIVADCATAAGVKALFATLKAEQRVPTALAHCIGNIRLGAAHRMAEKDFNDCLSANLVSAFHTLAGFTGHLRDAGSPGAAVFVSSAARRIGTPTTRPWPPPRPGSRAWCAARRPPTPAWGIRVNAVAPGHDGHPRHRGPDQQPHHPRSRCAPVPACPASAIRPSWPELMVWLLSPHGARVTGQVWSLDGGFSTIRPLVR